jgi:hypothetical protein
LRLAIVGLAVLLAACGPTHPTATSVAVFAPAALEARQGALAEQRDAARVEERASRSRRFATIPVAAPARATSPPAGGCGPGKKPRAVMVACWTLLVARYPWPNLAKVWSVMACESQGDPAATGPPTRTGRAHGLMQLMGGPYDPAQNIAAAWTKSRHGTDWTPWTCT